ncbi:MAG: calcium-binding protein, partial [Pseudomonadales bacterium]|nr:calcium-binding protein [Pseudomonadales bacterium]
TAGDGANLVFGDSGRIDAAEVDLPGAFLPGQPITLGVVESMAPAIGGNDEITTGDDEDIVIGGMANDTITTNGAYDIVLGDNALLIFDDDNDPADLDLITTITPTIGGADVIDSGSANDMVFGGTVNDEITAGADNDLEFGDHGKVTGDIDANLLPLEMANHPFVFTSIDTQDVHDGGDDWITGNSGKDIILGGQGNDVLYGNAGDDDIIGGHNVADGYDGDDMIDGGADNDVIAGDNALILRTGSSVDTRMRVLSGDQLYNANGDSLVTAYAQEDPTGREVREVVIYNHGDGADPVSFGADYIAGGAEDDVIFGQMGDDVIQGDGAIALDVLAGMASVEDFAGVDRDGDDYIEGNGGDDIIFGNLGQDDIIGDSSNLYLGLDDVTNRPTGADTIYGGAGTRVDRNTIGGNHTRDADTILGDNGIINRIVGTNGTPSGAFLTFTYDNYGEADRLIPRAFTLLDYTLGGDPSDRGQADLVKGGPGDDVIHGMTGNDVLFGDGRDDDIYGGTGSDRIYGGSGEDGIVGDDGKIFTSRNGETEPLNSLFVANEQTTFALPGPWTSYVEFIDGRLTKTVELTAWDIGGNEIIFGGLGDDFIHAGAGDDAVSGAEALPEFYNDDSQGSFDVGAAFTNLNPLGYDPATTLFYNYDPSRWDPKAKIDNFVLNFDAFETDGSVIEDGKDRIFGDLGHDWLVGGTGHDRLFGGLGDDLLQNDDYLETNGGANTDPDGGDPNNPDDSTWGDFAFGGGGRDVLIANTGFDRMYDWNGEYNSFIVPWSRFGEPTVVRKPSPAVINLVLDMGRSSGADQSLVESNGELGLADNQDTLSKNQKGGPRDPQPGNDRGRIDNPGGPEDDTDKVITQDGSTPGGRPGLLFSAGVDVQKAINAADPLNPTAIEDADFNARTLEIGDDVVWTYLVSNTGNVSLNITDMVDYACTPGCNNDYFYPEYRRGDDT